jgi:3-hydroxyacyl-[acyl-carrier-protein] dehydratase
MRGMLRSHAESLVLAAGKVQSDNCEMTYKSCRMIAADHPSLSGHFPDAPIVPAVIILDEVAAALAEWRKDARIVGIPMVKFSSALKPHQPFTIVLSSDGVGSDELNFSCLVQDRTAVRGRLLIRSQSTLPDERSPV